MPAMTELSWGLRLKVSYSAAMLAVYLGLVHTGILRGKEP